MSRSQLMPVANLCRVAVQNFLNYPSLSQENCVIRECVKNSIFPWIASFDYTIVCNLA